MSRTEQRETLLRRLRRDSRLFDDSPKTEQIMRCIEFAKKLNAPAWEERSRNVMNARMERFLALQ